MRSEDRRLPVGVVEKNYKTSAATQELPRPCESAHLNANV